MMDGEVENRFHALRLASQCGGTTEEIMHRTNQFYDFVIGRMCIETTEVTVDPHEFAKSLEKRTEVRLELAARTAHEVNRAFQMYLGEADINPTWDHLSDDLQDSTRSGVMAIWENFEITPEELHQKWADHKTEQGWTYGPVKDATEKRHPCLVPYNDLPEGHKFKDTLFHTVVRSILLNRID